MPKKSASPKPRKPQRKPGHSHSREVYDLEEYLKRTALLRELVEQATHLVRDEPAETSESATERKEIAFPEYVPVTGPEPAGRFDEQLDVLDADDRQRVVVVVYLDSADMASFAPVVDFDCRRIKLINYGRPAVSLRYSRKHKYQVERDLPPARLQLLARGQVAELLRLQQQGLAINTDLLAALKEAAEHPERYEAATSSYHRQYHYPYVTCRYRNQAGGHDSLHSHLIQGWNAIFIDTQATRPRRDDEEVTAYLEQFTHRFALEKTDVFLRRR